MSCAKWNDVWIGALYGELDETGRDGMERHLSSCEACASRWRELAEARDLLREAAPAIPRVPPLRVAAAAGLRRPLWAFAAGAAAAAALFTLGLLAGMHRTADSADGATAAIATRTSPQTEALLTRIDRLESRLEQVAAASTSTGLTRDELDDRLDRFQRSLQVARARDMEFVLDEIRATEWRASNWVDETRDALRLVALQADPRISQR